MEIETYIACAITIGAALLLIGWVCARSAYQNGISDWFRAALTPEDPLSLPIEELVGEGWWLKALRHNSQAGEHRRYGVAYSEAFSALRELVKLKAAKDDAAKAGDREALLDYELRKPEAWMRARIAVRDVERVEVNRLAEQIGNDLDWTAATPKERREARERQERQARYREGGLRPTIPIGLPKGPIMNPANQGRGNGRSATPDEVARMPKATPAPPPKEPEAFYMREGFEGRGSGPPPRDERPKPPPAPPPRPRHPNRPDHPPRDTRQ